MKSSFLPCTIVFWAVAVVFISSYLYIFYDKYTDNHCKAVEKQESLEKVFKNTCLDLDQKDLLIKVTVNTVQKNVLTKDVIGWGDNGRILHRSGTYITQGSE